MPDVDRLRRTLFFLDSMYSSHQTSEDPEEALAFSKLAVLEFCGWVEMTLDDIMEQTVRAAIGDGADLHLSKKSYIGGLINRNSGFNYDRNIAPILFAIIGLADFLNVEKKMNDEGLLDSFKSVLNTDSFTTMRNKAAHTFNDGTQRNFDSPSVVIGKLNQIAPILDRVKELCLETQEK